MTHVGGRVGFRHRSGTGSQRQDARAEHGAITIIFALVSVLLLLMAAIVIDLGLARDVRRQSQNASDASALAAANVLYPTGTCSTPPATPPCINDAVAAAKAYAEVNFPRSVGKWSTCGAPPAGYTAPDASVKCISFDSVTAPTKILVTMPNAAVATAFGGVTGVGSIDIGSAARTEISYQSAVPCGLCFLGDIDTVKFKADISGAGIAVAGKVDFQAAGANWKSTGGGIGVAGTVNRLSATPVVTPIATFADPWATKAGVPPTPTGTYKGSGANPCSSGPGIYTDYQFKNNCTLNPGVYTIIGDWTSKNITITATSGVTLYASCATAAAPTTPSVCTATSTIKGSLDLKNADLKLVSPTSPAAGAGLGIIYDRLNNSALSLQGNGVGNVDGAIYAPASNLDYNGTSDLVVNKGPIILKSMTGNGTTGVKATNTIGVAPSNGASIGTLDR